MTVTLFAPSPLPLGPSQVVKARGAAMAAAAASTGGRPHGMLSVVGLSDDQLQGLCEQAVQTGGEGTVCRIANYLFPQVRLSSFSPCT